LVFGGEREKKDVIIGRDLEMCWIDIG
jgi:hypothetical protein